MSLSSTDKGLLTPDNCAVIFIDHQPQMLFGVVNIDRQDLLNNVLVLAKAARIFGVPVILSALSRGASQSLFALTQCRPHGWRKLDCKRTGRDLEGKTL